jgi:hypothetical protein
MKKVGISVRWGIGDPQVGVKLNGYEGKGTEELEKVILVIKDSLISSLPGVPVKIVGRFKEIFDERG